MGDEFLERQRGLEVGGAPGSGTGRPRPTPGCRMLTMIMPRSSETSEADTNQPMVLAPTRPTAQCRPYG